MGKVIDRNGRLFGKVSIIDVAVVLVVLVMAAALYVKNGKLEIIPATQDESPVTFTVHVENMALNKVEALVVGDLVFDFDHNTGGPIGKITAIEELPAECVVQMIDGSYEKATNEYARNLRITVEGQGSMVDGRYSINGVYEIAMNSARNFYTPYGKFTGNVVEIG